MTAYVCGDRVPPVVFVVLGTACMSGLSDRVEVGEVVVVNGGVELPSVGVVEVEVARFGAACE